MPQNVIQEPIINASSLLKQLKERRQTTIDYMMAGSCKDYAEYKESVGNINGINVAIFHLEELVRELEESEDSGFENL
jgi:hypothetical protein